MEAMIKGSMSSATVTDTEVTVVTPSAVFRVPIADVAGVQIYPWSDGTRDIIVHRRSDTPRQRQIGRVRARLENPADEVDEFARQIRAAAHLPAGGDGSIAAPIGKTTVSPTVLFAAAVGVVLILAGIIIGAQTVYSTGTGSGNATISVSCGTAFSWDDGVEARHRGAVDSLADAFAGTAASQYDYVGGCYSARQGRQMITWAIIVAGILALGGAGATWAYTASRRRPNAVG